MITPCLTTTDDVADELERIGFLPTCSLRSEFIGRSIGIKPYATLRARIIDASDGIYVHFAERATFDRWANSSNFVVRIDSRYCTADLEGAASRACAICDAHVFDFNTYFHVIDLS